MLRIPEPRKLLTSHPIFSQLPEGDIMRLASLAVHEHYPTATLLVPKGARPNVLRYVIEGRADLIARGEDGATAALPIPRGGWVTWLGLFCPQPLDHEIWTTAHGQYLSFPSKTVLESVQGNRAALMAALNLVGMNMRLLIGWIHATTLSAPERRIAYLLLALMPVGKNADQVIRISREEIGQMGFGSRQFVSRTLQSLAANGVIDLKYGQIHIWDPAALLTHARGE